VRASQPARVPELALRGITKRFGATVALDGADLDVRAGTLHALLGENGAGKTTLMRLVFGMLRPDAGTIVFDGAERRWRSTADAIAAGIGMVHQHFLLVPAMTVAENVALGRWVRWGFFGGFRPSEAAKRVRSVAADAGLVLDPGARVSSLPVGAQQRLEIVKALARDARLLILDEPTAVLPPREAQDLYRWLRAFVAQGHTVVLITHKVREALAIADDVTVLRRGRTVLRGETRELPEDSIVQALLGGGARPASTRGGGGGAPGPPQLEVAGVSIVNEQGITRLRDATLAVHAGEIVGIAGVEGAGQHELLRVLAGRLTPTTGRVRIAGRLGFVPEDRLRDALVPAMTLVENFALKESGAARGRMPWNWYRQRAVATIADTDVRAEGVNSRAAALSGGNQQKFVLGRELEGNPQALVVENPTRGLDIRATAAILEQLRSARAAGVAVVLYSSDLEEVLSVADRIVVCFEGRLIAVDNDAEAAARAMVGAS
jgi:ABC-type uncharacterized transport system ATPase subunit